MSPNIDFICQNWQLKCMFQFQILFTWIFCNTIKDCLYLCQNWYAWFDFKFFVIWCKLSPNGFEDFLTHLHDEGFQFYVSITDDTLLAIKKLRKKCHKSFCTVTSFQIFGQTLCNGVVPGTWLYIQTRNPVRIMNRKDKVICLSLSSVRHGNLKFNLQCTL